MRQIRSGVFETNSSSTHSFCIDLRVDSRSFPHSLNIEIGEYGWAYGFLNTPHERADYLYTAVLCYFGAEHIPYVDKIKEVCAEVGVEVEFGVPEFKTYEGEDEWYLQNGYVDHNNRLNEFLEGVFKDKQSLIQFLFADGSWVHTSNDNSEDNEPPAANYPHDFYYKGNW